MGRSVVRLVWLGLLCAAGSAAAAPAPGKTQGKAKKPAEAAAPRLDATKLRAELSSPDASRIVAALDQIASAPLEQAPELAPLIEALLQRGATSKVVLRALEVLGVLAQPSSSAAIAPYLKHRDPALRQAALRAILITRGPVAVIALRQALRSSDASLRGPAATGLGSLGATDAVPDLLRALDHNVAEAAPAVGQLCDPEQCRDFVGRLGRSPFDMMASGVQAIVFRPSEQLPDAVKVSVVTAVADLGTNQARRLLRDMLTRWPSTGSETVRKALEALLKGEKAP